MDQIVNSFSRLISQKVEATESLLSCNRTNQFHSILIYDPILLFFKVATNIFFYLQSRREYEKQVALEEAEELRNFHVNITSTTFFLPFS